MTEEVTVKNMIQVAGLLLILASMVVLYHGVSRIGALLPIIAYLALFTSFGASLGIVLVYPIVLSILGIMDLILGIMLLLWSRNPIYQWQQILVGGIISAVTGFGIGIIAIAAAILAYQIGESHRRHARRAARPDRRAVPRRRRVYRRERLGRFRKFDPKIVKAIQAAQKSFKVKRWRTVAKHAWTAVEALLDKLYLLNFDTPRPETLTVEEAIRRLAPHLPRGTQTVAALQEVYRVRSTIKPGSTPITQNQAEPVLAAAQQLCYWFNIPVESPIEDIQPVVPKDEPPLGASCGVCNLPLRAGQRTLTTPCCQKICHYACLSEWVKVKQICPLCRQRLQFRDGKVQLRK